MKEIVFLILMTIPSTNDNPIFYYHEMDSMKQCQTVIATSKVRVATGGDAETSIAMYCANDKAKNRWGHDQ